jgi:uncharacterized protein
MTTYNIDIKFRTRVARSPRVLEVAEAFGIGLEDREFVVFDNMSLEVKQGDVVYITGQSGAGKSVLLRELARQMEAEGKTVVNLDSIQFEDKALIDQIGKDTNDAVNRLGVAGINDAYLYLRRPAELSDGQRYRFRLAKAMETGAQVWVADEFLAVLDRTAAKVIAYSLQKAARRAGATLIVATTHTDMVEDLYPSLMVTKRFREKVRADVFAEALERSVCDQVSRDQINDLLMRGV